MVFHFDRSHSEDFDQNASSPNNPLINYLHHQTPEVMARIARSITPSVKEIISQNVQGLVGVLPTEDFNVQITTDREDLAGLLASAMMTGYFLRQMEQRMELEDSIIGSPPLSNDSAEA